jgi:hypothetical protein
MKWGDDKTKKYYALVSRTGFTDKMLNLAKDKKIILIKGCEVLKL